jgi:hypothetical protein
VSAWRKRKTSTSGHDRAEERAEPSRQAAEEQTRAQVLHEEAAKAFEAAGARRERPPLGSPAQDLPGCHLRPDPSGVRHPAEFIEALRQFRTWAGNPSYRDMARACNGRPAASTMCRFATAWRQLTMPGHKTRSAPGLVRAFPGLRRPPRPEIGLTEISPA